MIVFTPSSAVHATD